MKTTQIEVREVLGEYDDKIKIYREPDNTFVIETDTATFKIKNGTIYLSGHIVGENYQLGTAASPLILLITDSGITSDGTLHQIGHTSFGDVGEPGLIKICDTAGAFVITLDGATGLSTIKGGLNLGTATGASPGQLKCQDLAVDTDTLFVDKVNHRVGINDSTPAYELDVFGTARFTDATFVANLFISQLQVYSAGNFPLYLKAGTDIFLRPDSDNNGNNRVIFQAPDATEVGSVDKLGNAQFKGNVEGKTSQLTMHTDPPPAASSTYNGQFYYRINPAESDRGELLFCIKKAGPTAFEWVALAVGP